VIHTNQDDPIAFFAEQPWTLGVIGLGYVGLPLLVTASQRGLGTIGYDVSTERVESLAQGRSPIDDVSDASLAGAVDAGAHFTTDSGVLRDADAIVVCVPSPLGRNRLPDMAPITAAAQVVREVARPGQLICLESTTYPGTTDDYFAQAVRDAGLTLDSDVWVAYSPERVSPGDPLKTGDIPKVVGGVTPASTAVAAAAYRRIVPQVHTVSSAAAAEMAKLLENTYRAVNIGLANEMAQLADVLGLDIWEVIDAAATKPFGFEPFWPGPGVGGHCIPLDPQYLAWRAREANFTTRFIDLAEQVNSQMPRYTVTRIGDVLNASGLALFGASILALGISYKRDVADDRESASLNVIEELTAAGATVAVLDSHVGDTRIQAHGLTPADTADLTGFDLAVVLTDHSDVDYARIAQAVPLVFDTRGVYRRLGLTLPNVTSL
jgi:UDP-N-acetyl-D-glucosamine dehydrogenase